MKRALILLIIVGVLLAVGLGAAEATKQDVLAQSTLLQLLNPGFEAGFRASGGVGELTVANDWQPFYDNNAPMRRPEYQAETLQTGKARVHTGQAAQKLFTTFSAHDGGIYQEVHQVTPGQWYTFSAWGYQWSSSEHNPDTSKQDGKCSILVGINPWGDANPLARTTVWGKEALQVYNQWVSLDVTAQAWSPKIVVALRQRCEWAPQHNDGYLDDTQLQLASIGAPQPTYTPAPTCTPCPASGSCPSLGDIRRAVREEIDSTEIRLGE